MTTRLSTTVNNVYNRVPNPENSKVIMKFLEFMKKYNIIFYVTYSQQVFMILVALRKNIHIAK
jgi:hypothetical protein